MAKMVTVKFKPHQLVGLIIFLISSLSIEGFWLYEIFTTTDPFNRNVLILMQCLLWAGIGAALVSEE